VTIHPIRLGGGLIRLLIHSPFPLTSLNDLARFVKVGNGAVMTKAQAAGLRVKWTEGEDRPCRHLHLELEHSHDGYLTDNYHCTACGELVAANTCDPFQVI